MKSLQEETLYNFETDIKLQQTPRHILVNTHDRIIQDVQSMCPCHKTHAIQF